MECVQQGISLRPTYVAVLAQTEKRKTRKVSLKSDRRPQQREEGGEADIQAAEDKGVGRGDYSNANAWHIFSSRCSSLF